MPRIVEYNEVYLEKSWEWLKDPEIRSLTLAAEFSREDQIKFFKNLPGRKDYWIKGVAEGTTPVGAVGLKNIDPEKGNAEYWGYVGDKDYWGKGIGKFMLQEAILHALELKLQSIYLRVASYNQRAITLYKKAGFKFCNETAGVEKYILQL